MAVPRLSSLLACRRLVTSVRPSVVAPSRQLSTSIPILDRYFTKKHEWVNVEGTKGTVGVSAYAADALGDIVYVQLPDPGTELAAGEECGVLESVKSASDMFSPVAGKVIEKNEEVETGPALINQSPLTDGWLFKCDMTNPDDVKSLLTSEEYDNYLKECEEH